MLRLDDGGKDPAHIAACRKAVLAYADAIQAHIPKLAEDLRARYGETLKPGWPKVTPRGVNASVKAKITEQPGKATTETPAPPADEPKPEV